MPPPLPRMIAVIGGDRRMLHAAHRLAESGMTVSLTGHGKGLPSASESALSCIASSDDVVRDAVRDADILLLPLPATRDGRTVNCPFAPEANISLARIITAMKENPNLYLFGGKLPAEFQEISLRADTTSRVIDYYDDEAFQLRNAYLTAEGALVLAGRETDSALRARTAAVIGYGRIGKLLARLLLAMGMEVTVCARRPEVLLWAATDGCHPMLMGDTTRAGGGMFPLCCGHSMIFNTVPAPVFDRELLLRLEPDTLLVDLASPPYGVREEDAREAACRNGLRYIRAPGIPGQYAPRDAGYAIADCVIDALRRLPGATKGETFS